MARNSCGASAREGSALNINQAAAAFEVWLLLPEQAGFQSEASFPKHLGAGDPPSREGSSQQEPKVQKNPVKSYSD